jgi:hypothetical protein
MLSTHAAAAPVVKLLQETISDFQAALADAESELVEIENGLTKPAADRGPPLADLTQRKADLRDDVTTYTEMLVALRTALAEELAADDGN